MGREPLKKLLRTGDRKWLTLQWNDEMEHLLGRSYSFFMYGDGIKNEGQCSCCQRTIVVELEKLDADGDVVADFEPAVLVERMVAQRPKQNSR